MKTPNTNWSLEYNLHTNSEWCRSYGSCFSQNTQEFELCYFKRLWNDAWLKSSHLKLLLLTWWHMICLSLLIAKWRHMLVFIIVFMLRLSLSLRGTLCILDCSSGCSDNHVGCTGAGLYNRGNSGDIQTGVRGPSINLTGWRSCQEYERMLWSMLLSGRVSRCAHTATVRP